MSNKKPLALYGGVIEQVQAGDTVDPAIGGTGVDGSAAANGNLLIGNGSGFTLATLTAGSNVTITNGSGTITIAASGGSGSPGGSNQQLQFNNSGAFGGANLEYSYNAGTSTAQIKIPDQTLSNAYGLKVNFVGSNGNGTGDGGTFQFTGGDGYDGGGSVTLKGGAATGAVGNPQGGNVGLIGGDGTSSSGANGGSIVLASGNALHGNKDGGNIDLILGYPSGSGNAGKFIIYQNTSTGINPLATLDFYSCANKTFTFPNATGTVALVGDDVSEFNNDAGYLSTVSLTSNVTGVLPLANGGTGANLTAPLGSDALVGWDQTDGSVEFFTIGTGLTYDNATHTLSSASASPAGSDKQVQFNDSGSFGATSYFTYDKSSSNLTVTSVSGATPNITVSIVGSSTGLTASASGSPYTATLYDYANGCGGRFDGGTGFIQLGNTGSYTTPAYINCSGVTAQGGIVFVSGNSATTALYMPSGGDIKTDTTTGTKVGTSTSEKLGFWGASPVTQQSTTGTTSGTSTGSSGNLLNDDATATGGTGSAAYTLGDIVLALKNIGVLAS